tara:strand:+ start:505 stop:870 length:366 start_codon:yes stop_codon:yes gene_type:complete
MEISFCDKCDNMNYIYLNPDTSELYNVCKSCGNSELKENESKQIYSSNTDGKSSISEIINLNPYISHDITLPVIKNNSNIKCNNETCADKETCIKYIKYDNDNMKFIYICNHCGTKWLNTI